MPYPFRWMGPSQNLDRWPLRLNGEPAEAAVADIDKEMDLHRYLTGSDIPFYVEKAPYPLTNYWQICVPVSRLEEAKKLIQESKEEEQLNTPVFLEDIEELWKQGIPEE